MTIDNLITPRLKSVIDFVPNGSIVYDVGSDHGFVPIYLVSKKISPLVYCSENKIGPYTILKENTKEYENIHPLLCDGLEKLTSDVSVITISGLGGNTIIDVVAKVKDKLPDTIIIEPQSHIYKVRDFFSSIGYMIKGEKYIHESDNKYYPVIMYQKGQETLDVVQLNYGTIAITCQDMVLKEYLEKLEVTYSKLPPDVKDDKLKIVREALRRWKR